MDDVKQKLIQLLSKIFQFENEDLDFGVYKILNYKKEEISHFIQKDLIEEISNELDLLSVEEKLILTRDLERIKKQLQDFGVSDNENNPKYQKKKEELKNLNVSEEIEKKIYNHIYAFFSRYYDKGDFISKRRYGRNNKYAIPYNGEETSLYWANNDQYYIKTSEFLQKYSFKIPDLKVNYRIVEAEEGKGNVKSDGNKFFIVLYDSIYSFVDKELNIYFEYRGLTKKEKKEFSRPNQDKINDYNVKIISNCLAKDPKFEKLLKTDESDKTILEKHLNRYTARNTYDYFIHKDLKGFLDRELDFYIKNEILDLSDVTLLPREHFHHHILEIKVFKGISSKIIDFVAQIENFQKKLWEKKKFILSTDYVISLDKVPDEFHDEILDNKEQILEWNSLFPVKIKSKKDFIKEKTLKGVVYLKLPVDTSYFTTEFNNKLIERLSENGNLNDLVDGTLIKGENFQSLTSIIEKYRNKIKLIYIDPPFNTGNDEFLYKDSYQHSSWLTLIQNRLEASKEFLREDGIIAVHIDDNEHCYLKILMDEIFGRENFISSISIQSSTPSGLKTAHRDKTIIKLKDHLLIYKNKKIKVNPVYIKKDKWDTHYSKIFDKKTLEIRDIKEELISMDLLKEHEKLSDININSKKVVKYYIENKDAIFQTQPEMPKEIKEISKNKHDEVIVYGDEHDLQYAYNGRRLAFLSNALNEMENGELDLSNLLCDIWYDIDFQNTQNEGATSFPSGKKPERLLLRLLKLFTNEGDIVLDFFLGSGTTCAVAKKMDREFIGIENVDYNENDSIIRLKNVIYGEKSGISKLVNWNGGGFFKYHKLEQYEDSLENIKFSQKSLDEFSDYFVRYMLDFETRDSKTFLNIDKMENPFEYKINVLDDYQLKAVHVDLPETYNYLIGLDVNKIRPYKNEEDNDRRYLMIQGKNGNRSILVVWRDIRKFNPEKDQNFLEKTIRIDEFDEVHLNGDSLIPEAVLIEENFKRLMNGS